MTGAPVNQTKLAVKILPNAAHNEVLGLTNSVWRIKIAAPPEKGKANKALIEFLSDCLGVRKDSLTILKGHTSHNKLVSVLGLNHGEVVMRLTPEKGK